MHVLSFMCVPAHMAFYFVLWSAKQLLLLSQLNSQRINSVLLQCGQTSAMVLVELMTQAEHDFAMIAVNWNSGRLIIHRAKNKSKGVSWGHTVPWCQDKSPVSFSKLVNMIQRFEGPSLSPIIMSADNAFYCCWRILESISDGTNNKSFFFLYSLFYIKYLKGASIMLGHLWHSCVVCNCVFLLLAGRRRPWRRVWHWGADCQTRPSSSGSCRRSRALASSCSGRWLASSVHTFWPVPCASYSTMPSCSPSPRCSGKT